VIRIYGTEVIKMRRERHDEDRETSIIKIEVTDIIKI
jgi:hypothetical protein